MVVQPARRYSRRTRGIVLAIIIIVAAGGFLVLWNQYRSSCMFSAGPLALGLRVISDDNQTPIADAQVEATNTALLCNGAPGEPQRTTAFVTNGTEWHYLDIGEDASYSFAVTYSGHSYSFSTGLGIEDVTCATLFIPSGRTSVTFAGFQNTCTSTTTTITTTTTTLSPNPGGSTTADTGNTSISCPLNTICGSFTYTAGNQVWVDSVQATQFVCNNCGAVNGQSYVLFAVTFENTGNSTINIAAGTGALSVAILGNSTVLHSVKSEVCAGTSTIVALGHGQNYAMYAPACDAGFEYQLAGAGSVTVTFDFNWTANSQTSLFLNSTYIKSQFNFT